MRGAILLVLAVATYAPVRVSTTGPDLTEVLARAGRYVAAFERTLGTVIAEERYVQVVDTTKAMGGSNFGVGGGPGVMEHDTKRAKRTTISEFLMLRLSNTPELWTGVRDVLQVDGKVVVGREGRLERLLRESPGDLGQQWLQLSAESARYNLGPLERDFNVPTFALVYLRDSIRERSRFEKTGEEGVSGTKGWKVGFFEERRPTLVLDRNRNDVPLRGTFWIDPRDGRVLRTRIEAGDRLSAARFRIEVVYSADARLGVLVPIEMTERYENAEARVDAKATYTKYRRFEVDTRIIGPADSR